MESTTHVDNSSLDLFRLTGLRRIALRLDRLELALIPLDSPLKLWDVIPVQPLASLKHLSQAHKPISHTFQIFQHALVPRPAFIL